MDGPVPDVARTVADAFLAGDMAAVVERLAGDAVFHSPVADYRGRADAARVLTLLAPVLGAGQPTAVHAARGVCVMFFAAAVGDAQADGVLRVVAGADGAVTELTLMLRPLAALSAGVKQMQAALDAAAPRR